MPKLPDEFLQSVKNVPGMQLSAFIEAHQQPDKLTSIRRNPFKPVELDFLTTTAVPWLTEGSYLAERPQFTLDPLFHAGCYYVQEAGSMFLGFAINHVKKNNNLNNVLDVCAAPGGKSTLALSLLDNDALLISNEIIKNRSLTLTQNLGKWGKSNTLVVNNNMLRLRPLMHLQDLVIIDAPCSGSGLFRKQAEAIHEWTPNTVATCALRQKEILDELLPELKEGAFVFYSTCSYAEEENELIAKWAIDKFGLEIVSLPIQPEWGIIDSGWGYRFYPDQTQSEGFYGVLLQKTGPGVNSGNRQKKLTATVTKSEYETLGKFVNSPLNELTKVNGLFFHAPAQVQQVMAEYGNQLYIRKAGTCIGEIKGSDFVPHHELALSCDLTTKLEQVELDKETAIKYLRKDQITILPPKKGIIKFGYKGYGIGWGKILANRINNYLPNEVRILMSA